MAGSPIYLPLGRTCDQLWTLGLCLPLLSVMLENYQHYFGGGTFLTKLELKKTP